MAGGGVGEAMLIGAAVGAGTGGIMSAAQDKDVGQGMLLGALGGAATGGIGSGIGGAASSAAENIAANAAANTATDIAANTAASAATDTLASTAANTAAENTVNTLAQQGANQAASSMSAMPNLASTSANINTGVASNVAAEGASQGAAGMGQGIFPGMSNANVAGAATTGGISGLMAANGQPTPYEAPGQETYNGPLSKFKMAGPSLSQYNYNPSSFQPSVAPGYASGGIANLQTGLFPQSQMDRTQFATPTQMPVSREIIASDYDQTINPYTGDLPRFADGGGINFIHNLQPGGEFGDMTADIYGAVQEHKPKWLQDIEPGGFIGATVPGKLDWEEKKRKEEEEKLAQDRAAKEAKAAAMYNQLAQGSNAHMARGGIADLGSYSDGGRLLRGPGDGMSDNIPASIGGKQPARLADGEFVVPADVVSHLGNGSTDAGAKTLYSMMDKVRKARTGNKKQGREINPDKYVPGMAQGGEVKRYAQGNLVVNPETNEVGYWTGGDEWGIGREWTPYGSSTSTLGTPATTSPTYNPSVYTPTAYNYSPYTLANRPSGNAPQYYGDIYQGGYADYSTPGYTLTGGNLGQWNNVAGEAQRAAQPASMNQQVTQSYLQNLGRAPDQSGLNYWLNSGLTGQQANRAIGRSQEAAQVRPDVAGPGFIDQLYQAYLGRSPEQSGAAHWQQQLSGGMTPAQIEESIKGSAEATARRPKTEENKRRGGIASLRSA